MKISLNGVWKVTGFAPDGRTLEFPGQVPGCVHTDLLREGIISDIYWRDNSSQIRWIEDWNWRYDRVFTADSTWKDAFLECEGLDTYCDIFLNGVRIGTADDMFVLHRFPVSGLCEGENTLSVVFQSPVARTRGLPARSGAFTTERMYTRRIQCTYSWDWVDRFVTMGIYRNISLHVPSGREIEDVFCETRTIDSFGALLFGSLRFTDGSNNAYAILSLTDPSGQCVYFKRRRIVEPQMCEMINLPDPLLWWPNGYGEQPLYTFSVTVEENGQTIDHRETRIGIRTMRIAQIPDKPGTDSFNKCLLLKQSPHVSGDHAFWDRNTPEEFSSFILVVNGVPVFCKGANWVPCEPFPDQETPEKITGILNLARSAGVNMIRVWGGGIFEQDAFYDTCDRLGILVTQDFLMACGSYPEGDPDFLEKLKLETQTAALRLRGHCCLAWWTGDNENGMNGDEDMLEYNGRRAALGIMEPVLSQLDPNRPFLPSSPYGGRPYGSITKGTTHNTNYIGEWFSYIRYHDMRNYRSYFEGYLSRFCAEEPIMGMPSVSSMRRFLNDEDIFGENEEMLRYHTKNNPSEVFREFQIYDYLGAISDKLLGLPRCPEDRIMKRQYTQYEWIRITMELYRREKWFSSGLIYWMLNDCWPASGWAIIDYYGRPKAAWYGFRRSAKPVIASIDHKNGQFILYVTSDLLRPVCGTARLFLQPFDSLTPVWQETVSFTLESNSAAQVLTVPETPLSADTLLLAEIQTEEGSDRTWFFEERPQDVHFNSHMPEILESAPGVVRLKAKNYIHAVSLDVPAGFIEDNFFSMLPGEEREIRYSGTGPVTIRVLDSAEPSRVL